MKPRQRTCSIRALHPTRTGCERAPLHHSAALHNDIVRALQTSIAQHVPVSQCFLASSSTSTLTVVIVIRQNITVVGYKAGAVEAS